MAEVEPDAERRRGHRPWAASTPVGFTLDEVHHDTAHELGVDPGLVKDGVEAHLQRLLAEHITAARRRLDPGPARVHDRHRAGRPAVPTATGAAVAVEIKRRGEIDGVEQLTRYLELINRDPLLAPVTGIFAAQVIKPQARTLAEDRGIRCVVLDYDPLKGSTPASTASSDRLRCSPPGHPHPAPTRRPDLQEHSRGSRPGPARPRWSRRDAACPWPGPAHPLRGAGRRAPGPLDDVGPVGGWANARLADRHRRPPAADKEQWRRSAGPWGARYAPDGRAPPGRAPVERGRLHPAPTRPTLGPPPDRTTRYHSDTTRSVAFLVAPEVGGGADRAWRPSRAGATRCSTAEGTVQAYNHLDKGDSFDVDVTVGAARSPTTPPVLPGGVANPDALRTDNAVAFVRQFVQSSKPVADLPRPWTSSRPTSSGHRVTSWPSLHRPAQRRRDLGGPRGRRRRQPHHQP